jgi:tRNA threonylcarbamoyladenosine biosynthesis protein TsaE
MRLELRTETAEETRAVGEALAGLLEAGDAVVLTGELGAGKTTLVQGVARGSGVQEHVVSPTFTLVREYAGRLDLTHVDVYRLDRVQDVVDLGLDELGDGRSVLLVEWGDAIEDLLPGDRLRVELTTADPLGGEARRIVMTSASPAWAGRWDRLEESVRPWGGSG